ncbi:splicing factor 45 [Phlebotomus argentipes]|uniref:splicing factor 45 n=1 Tax=Phlebotomus argentipes TaxID=94469 RepID=UPI0028932EE7|nr:splicing factor 45 [Phlebotomus argentipes]
MALYDDLDTKQRADQIDGWSSGIKLLQSQLAVKKAAVGVCHIPRKATTLAPVIDLKAKKDGPDDIFKPQSEVLRLQPPQVKNTPRSTFVPASVSSLPEPPVRESTVTEDADWSVVDEYDPMWPNDYEKLVKEKRDKEREKAREREERKREERNTKRRVAGVPRIGEEGSPPVKYMGFGGRPAGHSDDEEYSKSPPAAGRASMGAAIAPPPSLQENSTVVSDKLGLANVGGYGTSSVAAKIMAKYGFKDGQGLGKQEQGMAVALQVEKTSKRGGRIIHEKEFMPPPSVPSPPPQSAEPSITEIMKSPSKVVLLRNMVGPGDVDSELEPEVKDECNTKYGDVVMVVIHEVPDTNPEEAVRIFVEFKRIESAIKAVVDLNGRFFGGRQVKAGFYDFEKFQNLQLLG